MTIPEDELARDEAVIARATPLPFTAAAKARWPLYVAAYRELLAENAAHKEQIHRLLEEGAKADRYFSGAEDEIGRQYEAKRKLEAENAAKDARIKELEERVSAPSGAAPGSPRPPSLCP